MSFFLHPVQMFLGLAIWSVWFILMYSLLSIGCEVAPISLLRLNGINLILFCCTWITLIILIYLAYHGWKKCKTYAAKNSAVTAFILWVSFGGYVTAVIATFSIGMMVLFFPPCL
ncbi:hypothetical protein [Legionella clemsonensis]|uniref:Uncharacterized protein n=1 Tax=Legionella clemsonensis TaxID=1867846 RepID=A0A222P027_9GAMM|nr:hypothetical protein [Legionella clemsonensis]ASQ45181.1 hypothetical protein clem_03115 [Legionella clemsonensis]